MTSDSSSTFDGGGDRLMSLDVYRGAVMLLLITNTAGGFSFYEMLAREPENIIWRILAQQFTHVQWSGCSLWDLVMPSFLFLVGVSLPYSRAARKQRGESDRRSLVHAVLRAVVLLMLGIFVTMPIRTYWDFIWPLLLLTPGLPVSAWLTKMLRLRSAHSKVVVDMLWWVIILSASAIRLVVKFDQLGGLSLGNILAQVGLGYLFAFLVVGRHRAVQTLVAFGILAAYCLAFLAYPLPDPTLDLATIGVTAGDEVYSGYFAHWNKNTNFAAAFDTWFLNLFPRSEPFLFNDHGYQTLIFIPVIALMIFGVMTGEYLRAGQSRVVLRNRLLSAGCLAVFAGLLSGWMLCPIVKSIWTLSWTLFSAGWCLILLATFYHIVEVRLHRSWAFPLIVAGRNPLLLYVLALKYQWWVVEVWRRTVASSLFGGYGGPVLESVTCGLTLWLVAFALYRLKVFVRI